MKRLSIIATVLLTILAYIGIGHLTYDSFIPWALSHNETSQFNLPNVVRFYSLAWPVTWTIWSVYKISINYTLAVVVSLGLLAGFYPVQHLILQRINKRKLKVVEQKRRLNKYLKENGVDWI